MRVGDADFQRAVELTIHELRGRARSAAQLEDCRITYKELSGFLAAEGLTIPFHGDLMSQLLAVATRQEDAEGRGMISALVVATNFGKPTLPGAGFYSLARKPPFSRVGDSTEIWMNELRRVHAENSESTDPAPAARTVTRENLGAWLLKCNPRTWDFEAFRQTGQLLDNWSVQPTYRTELIEAGQRVLLWVTGSDGATPQPGLWGTGFVTDHVYPGSPETGDPLWLDEEKRDLSTLFVPFTMQIWDEPIARPALQADPQLAGMEIFRQPQMSNPVWVSTTELEALQAHVSLPALTMSVTEHGAGFGDALTRRAVELAAVDAVIRHYNGWHVADVSRNNCGWDLTCTSTHGEEHHVEVKGVSGTAPSILLTRNEARAARDDATWRLVVVTQALTDPQLHIVDGPTAVEASEPFVYTVNLTHR